MKHNNFLTGLMSSQFSKFLSLCFLTLTLTISGNVWGDNITFQGNETFYFDKASNSGWGHLDAPDADVYLEFANSGNNKTKSSPAQWEKQDDILKVTVPAGTYNQVHIVRTQKGNPGNIYNQFDWITLQTGKNQILYGGGWATYGSGGGDEPSTKTFKGGEVFYMDQNMIAKSDGQKHDFLKYERCDFNIYNPDNTSEFWGGLTGTLIPNTTIIKFVVTSDFAGKKWGWVKVKQLEKNGTGHNETAKVAIPTDGKNYIKADGSTSTDLNWGTYAEPTPYTGDLWLVGGACIGQSWNQSGCTKMTNLGGGIYTITTQIKSTTEDDGFKFKENNSNWDNQWRPTESQAITFRGSNRVMVLSSNEENVPFQKPNSGADTKWQIVTDGDYTYTITIDLSDKDNGKMSIKKDDTPCTHPQSGTWLYLSGNTDLTGQSWVLNTIKLDWDCDEGVYYHTFTNLGHNINSKYHFKIQKDNTWTGELNTDAIDNNHSGANLELLAPVNSNKEIGISLPQDADVTIYTDGSKVWAHADMATPAAGDKTLYLNCKDFTGWPQHATTLAVWDGVEYRSFTKIPDCANDDLFVATNVHSAGTYKFEFYNKSDNSSHSVSLNLTGTNNACKVTNWDSGEAQTITPNYTIHFNKNGHGSDIADRCVAAGSSTTDPQATATDGWVCKGWYTNDGLTDKFIFGTTTITAGITLYAKWEQVEMVTVTFDAKGGEPVPANQVIEKGTMATKPATDPAKAGYNFTGWDWNFDNTIDADKTINAQYTLKGVESVTLDQPTMKLLENGTTGTLFATVLPNDVLNTTTTWSSDNESVATVENGVVTPHALGTATITCTVANTAGSESATCTISVVDCELVPTAIFDGVGEIANPFDPSGQPEPAKITQTKIRIGDNGSGTNYYAYDDNGIVKASTTGEYWIMEEAGKTGSNIQMYYLKSASTGKYMYRQNDRHCDNGDWWTYTVATETLSQTDAYKWYVALGSGNKGVIVSKLDGSGNQNATQTDCILHRRHWTDTGLWSGAPANSVTAGRGATQGGGGYTDMQSAFTNMENVPNPNYKTATITKDEVTYYRFATNGTMTCTLTGYALKAGDKISVYCYNTASSTVSGELHIGGSKVADINLNAGASTYKHTVTNDSKGATQIVVATSNADFCVASVKVERERPIGGGKVAGLAWTPTPADPVVATVGEGDITTYTATATSAGEITYSSSDTEVATVNATTGVVTPVAAGNAVITATIEQEGCYAEGSISYNLHLNDLPKPEITFVTLPEGALPQGLANQAIKVTTTGGGNFNLAITEGTGATLNITENTGTQITATLSMGANATNIVLTASTARTTELAQHAVTANVAVSACIPEGANIFEFTLTGSDAATGQVAGGIIGGTVDQTALGTVGTEDNPAMVDAIKIKMKDNKYVYDNNGKVEVKDNEGGSECQWAMIPTGETYKPSWSGNTYNLYYLQNVSTNKYMKRGAGRYGSNSDWYYYTTVTDATLGNGDEYKWFKATDNGTVIVNRADVGSSLNKSYHLHDCNQYNSETNQYAAKPAVPCGITSDVNDYTKVNVTTSSVANPSFFKSVEYKGKTYYIIFGGSITLHGDFKAGDVVNVDTYNRKTNEDDVEEYQIQADADSYTYTTTNANAYVCVNNIKVWRNQVGEMVTPTLTWDADLSQPQIVDLKNGVAPVHVATANVTTVSTITYSSSNTDVATVNGAGQVSIEGTPNHGATTTITATMAAVGCYNEASVSYTIRIKNIDPTTLQTMIEGTSAGGTLVLADDYDGCEATINKAITIDAQGHQIGNLTVEKNGDLTLSSGLIVNDFTICAKAGNTSTPAASGQVQNANNLTVNGNAYFLYTVDPNGQIQYGWYDFTVPFPVDVRTGIKGIQDNTLKENFTNEVDYAVLEYLGQKRAQGQYSYQKFSGVMQPNRLYSITLDDDYNYNTLRFQKTAGGALVASENVELKAFSGADADANWNGVGNGTLRHADADVTSTYLQVYQSGNKSFLLVEKDNYSFVIGSAFMVQEIGTMTLSTATHDALLTPNRQAEAMKPITIQIAREGQVFTDQLFISASEDGGQQYTMGVDLAKAGDLGYATVPQLWVNAYDHPLCAYDAQMIDGQAHYLLSLYAPAAGEYTLNTKNIPEGITLYLVQNGNILWDLSQTYTLELAKGITNDYGLLLVEEHKVTTGNDNLMNDNNADKILRNGILYILHNGKTFNAQGACISK